MNQIKESQKAYLTKSNLILVGSVCLISNVLLLLAITDLFTENPFVFENMLVFIIMIGSVLSFLAMLKKYKEYTG